MPLSIESPQFRFTQNKEKRNFRSFWKKLSYRFGVYSHMTHAMRMILCSTNWFPAAFVYCLSNINNYEQSITTSIWNNPNSVTVSGTAFHFSSHH